MTCSESHDARGGCELRAISPSSETTVEFHLGHSAAAVSSRHTVAASASMCRAMRVERLNVVRVVEATPSGAVVDMDSPFSA